MRQLQVIPRIWQPAAKPKCIVIYYDAAIAHLNNSRNIVTQIWHDEPYKNRFAYQSATVNGIMRLNFPQLC